MSVTNLAAGGVTELATADGTVLHAETIGRADAPVTVLLVHGWTCSTRSWHNQLAALPHLLGVDVRVVAYDQRGHGLSSLAPEGTTTMAHLAGDLAHVVETLVPAGRIVYAGHSMGGMALMELGAQRPELVRERFAGVTFVSTSAGRISSRPFGLPARFEGVAAAIMPRATAVAGRRADRRARRFPNTRRGRAGAELTVSRVQRPGVRYAAFGQRPDRREVDVLAADLARTPGATLTGFLQALIDHDPAGALGVFDGIPVEVMHGTRDRLLPPRHGSRLAGLIPGARLWMYPGAGHMLAQERPRDVTLRIAAQARRALE
jgi:pimeloyl-ACP methyl ester carboxylesterase